MKIHSLSFLLSKINVCSFPFFSQISLTNRCNEDCIHCLVSKNPSYELNTAKIKSIISELRELNCMEITFTGGEPFLREDFFEILYFTKSKGMGMRILSNGTLINEYNIALIKEINPLNIQLSLYGATPKTHDFTTRLKGSFVMTTNALRLLKENKLAFTVATMVMRHNFHEISKLKEIAEKENWKIIFDYIIRPGYDGYGGHLKTRISNYQIKRAGKLKLLPYVTERGNLKRYHKEELFVSSIGKSHLFISNKGYVSSGISLKINCGNLEKETLKSVWFNSKELNYLRALKLEDFECANCKFCFNCCWDPGLAFAEHHNMFKRPKEFCRFMKHITN